MVWIDEYIRSRRSLPYGMAFLATVPYVGGLKSWTKYSKTAITVVGSLTPKCEYWVIKAWVTLSNVQMQTLCNKWQLIQLLKVGIA